VQSKVTAYWNLRGESYDQRPGHSALNDAELAAWRAALVATLPPAPADVLVRLFATLGQLLVEGGLFLNADYLPTGASQLDALGKAQPDAWLAANFAAGAENWETYWQALAAEPALAGRAGPT
jgi:hypothetical protein